MSTDESFFEVQVEQAEANALTDDLAYKAAVMVAQVDAYLEAAERVEAIRADHGRQLSGANRDALEKLADRLATASATMKELRR